VTMASSRPSTLCGVIATSPLRMTNMPGLNVAARQARIVRFAWRRSAAADRSPPGGASGTSARIVSR
jgi:hypothetical protein